MTFRGPFEVTGNGYFACWGGVLTYCVLAVQEFENSVARLDPKGAAYADAPAAEAEGIYPTVEDGAP